MLDPSVGGWGASDTDVPALVFEMDPIVTASASKAAISGS